MANAEPARNAWYLRTGLLDSGLHRVTAYVDSRFADGKLVTHIDPASLAGVPQLWQTESIERGIVRVVLASTAAPGAPNLWFVNVDEPKSLPRATNLVAFATDHFRAGTVVDRYVFGSLGVSNDEQAGAVRWYRETGVIHQIFVAQQWRRQQVGTALLYTASAFHQTNGWPGRLQADGRRTELGERLAAALKHPDRVSPLSELMPSMDEPPPGSAANPASPPGAS